MKLRGEGEGALLSWMVFVQPQAGVISKLQLYEVQWFTQQ